MDPKGLVIGDLYLLKKNGNEKVLEYRGFIETRCLIPFLRRRKYLFDFWGNTKKNLRLTVREIKKLEKWKKPVFEETPFVPVHSRNRASIGIKKGKQEGIKNRRRKAKKEHRTTRRIW